MQIVPWPLVPRELLVRVFRPGDEATSEGPFRTLRRRNWATAGVRIATRADGRAAGQVTVFSTLNIEAVRSGRCAQQKAATRWAAAAARLEASAEFARLVHHLAGLSPDLVRSVAHGVVPEGFPRSDEIWPLLAQIARRTGQMIREWPAGVVIGRISAVRDENVVITTASGERSMIPRWLARSAHRADIGDELVVLTDRPGDSSIFVVAFPALDIDRRRPTSPFDPFARDARVGALTMSDVRKLSGEPAPPRVLVPVAIEG